MIFEEVIHKLEEGDAEITESFKSWLQYHGGLEGDEILEDFAIDYSTGLWR